MLPFRVEVFGDVSDWIVEVDDVVLSAEGRESRHESALGSNSEAAAIEDEFVVPTNRIAINHRASTTLRSVLHEWFAGLVFTPRATGWPRGLRGGQFLLERARLEDHCNSADWSEVGMRPDVFTNRNAYLLPFHS